MVIGIIALLIGILIPALLLARRQSYTVRCLSNQRQLMAAVLAYAAANDGFLPAPNWDGNAAGKPVGWLYKPGSPFQESDVQNGTLYPYLNTMEVYRCPQDGGTYDSTTVAVMTSYIMNGSVCNFGHNGCTNTKLSQYKGNAILLWEIPAFVAPDTGQVNDGADAPWEGITTRHNHGTTVGCADGHAEALTWTAFTNEWFNNPPGRLWCAPGFADGGKTEWPSPYTSPPPEPTVQN